MINKYAFVLTALFLFAACDFNPFGDSSDGAIKKVDTTDYQLIDTNLTDIYRLQRIACVDTINKYRATEGLAALARWDSAEVCADSEADTDSKANKSHSAFNRCGEWAQNECPGWGSVESITNGCLQMMWNEKLNPSGQQGHYINMKNTAYKKVACGFYVTTQGKVWAVQDFK